ncbi:TetR/AcrR family transcriptional regulator [Herbiconiux daphne]|uniref:WHG domain-containing protein n=1 Tax=Herbiconiux daphne TaxID=2970914 RepID=A0ABT2H4B8_9MICO|nr:TetR-like C-terminal domain-containing protein [Herbiconiux daphne]MCS5734756.1 WHG domain-containing protein [Herbiconiux daphne]
MTSERVALEGEQLADEVGLESVTLAAVAARLGIKLPSLYKHIDGLGALRATIAERAIRELTDVMVRATVGRSGADAVSALAHALRSWAQQHPGRYAATISAPRDTAPEAEVAAADQAVRVIFDVLAGFGLSGDDAIDATRGLRAVLHGFVALEAAGGFGLPVDVDRSFDRLIDSFVRSLPSY